MRETSEKENILKWRRWRLLYLFFLLSSSSQVWKSAAFFPRSHSLSFSLKVSLPLSLSFVAVISGHAFTGGGGGGGRGGGRGGEGGARQTERREKRMMMLMKMVEGESDTAAESEEEEDGAFTSLSPSLSPSSWSSFLYFSRTRTQAQRRSRWCVHARVQAPRIAMHSPPPRHLLIPPSHSLFFWINFKPVDSESVCVCLCVVFAPCRHTHTQTKVSP